MSGTVEVDDSSLAPTASSILIGRGMKTAFLMVGLQAPVGPLLVCVVVCVCVSLGAATCLARSCAFRCWCDYQEDEKSVCASYV